MLRDTTDLTRRMTTKHLVMRKGAARNSVAYRCHARKFGRDGCKPRAVLHTRRPESRQGRYRRLLFRCRVQVRCLTRCGAGPRLQSEQRTVCSRTWQDYGHRHVVFRVDHSDQKSGRLMPQTLGARAGRATAPAPIRRGSTSRPCRSASERMTRQAEYPSRPERSFHARNPDGRRLVATRRVLGFVMLSQIFRT
jgi:hypothetical protein